jgi:hypothetical protein
MKIGTETQQPYLPQPLPQGRGFKVPSLEGRDLGLGENPPQKTMPLKISSGEQRAYPQGLGRPGGDFGRSG